jgi:pimeloyl-ACP methyl ester carboxylesterase
MYQRNVAQHGDALALLRSLPDRCTSLVFFDLAKPRAGPAEATRAPASVDRRLLPGIGARADTEQLSAGAAEAAVGRQKHLANWAATRHRLSGPPLTILPRSLREETLPSLCINGLGSMVAGATAAPFEGSACKSLIY